MTLSRSSVVAIMRGVYWPLATWMATSSEPNVKTTNERLSVMTVLASALAPSIPSSSPHRPSASPGFHPLDDGPEHALGQAGKHWNNP